MKEMKEPFTRPGKRLFSAHTAMQAIFRRVLSSYLHNPQKNTDTTHETSVLK
jgi:hypothetical protein